MDETQPLLNVNRSSDGITIDRLSVYCVYFTEVCERLAFYSVTVNLILYCTSHLEMSTTTASTISIAFSGSVFIVPIFGGFVADTMAGKYKTIVGCGFILIIGLVTLTSSAIHYGNWFGPSHSLSKKSKTILFHLSLVLITIGSGGIKSNIGPLGAEKIQHLGPAAVQSFFNWFYWYINVGSLIAETAIASVQQNIGYAYGFLIPLGVMIFGQIVFICCKNRFHTGNLEGSPLREVLSVCCATRCRGFDRVDGERFSAETVRRVRSLLRMLPIYGLFIVYWAVYSQINSTFFLQSEHLKLEVISKDLPVGVLHGANSLACLIFIPVLTLFVYPLLSRINRSPSMLKRIGIGMVFAVLSVMYAGILEIYRKQDLSVNQTVHKQHFNASSVSVLAQIPQFSFFGISEVFTAISGMILTYTEAPDMLKGVCMGLFLETAGIGSYFALLILEIVKDISGRDPPDSWFPEDMNYGKTEYFFFLLAVLMFLNFLLFLYVSSCYHYRNQQNSNQHNYRNGNDQFERRVASELRNTV